MSKAPTIDRLAESVAAAANAAGFSMRSNSADYPGERALEFEIYRSSDILMTVEFRLQLKKGALFVAYPILLRWPLAEQIDLETRAACVAAREEPPEVRRVRAMQFPLVQLKVSSDPSYFERPAPLRFQDFTEREIMAVVDMVASSVRRNVISEFRSYCDPERLSEVVMLLTERLRLVISLPAVAVILAAANKRQEFKSFAEACRDGALGREGRSSYMLRSLELLAARLEREPRKNGSHQT